MTMRPPLITPSLVKLRAQGKPSGVSDTSGMMELLVGDRQVGEQISARSSSPENQVKAVGLANANLKHRKILITVCFRKRLRYSRDVLHAVGKLI
jgi:hypothetical protein